MLGRKLTPAEVAILETFVVPRYLTSFGELALELMLTGEVVRVAHFGCRSGYPDLQLIESIPNCTVTGVDSSLAAIELARNKAAILPDVGLEYLVATEYPTELEAGAYSHALSIHPIAAEGDRVQLFEEMSRVLYSGGQALVALPLRGSFQELGDLLREYALKHDQGELGKAAEVAMLSLPTIETLSEELEALDLEDVDVEMRQKTLKFESGRAFTEDPITRLFIVPELQALMDVEELHRALDYISQAIDKYWAKNDFEINVNVGAASARKA